MAWIVALMFCHPPVMFEALSGWPLAENGLMLLKLTTAVP
jgi:hypothetical protein